MTSMVMNVPYVAGRRGAGDGEAALAISDAQRILQSGEETLTPQEMCIRDRRRWCLKNNCRGNVDIFRQEYPSCPEEAFLMSGRPVFDNRRVTERIAELMKRQEEKPRCV